MIWKVFLPFCSCSGCILFWIFQLQWLALHEIVFWSCKVILFMQLRYRRKVEDFNFFYFTSLSLGSTGKKGNIAPWIKLIDQLRHFNIKSTLWSHWSKPRQGSSDSSLLRQLIWKLQNLCLSFINTFRSTACFFRDVAFWGHSDIHSHLHHLLCDGYRSLLLCAIFSAVRYARVAPPKAVQAWQGSMQEYRNCHTRSNQ